MSSNNSVARAPVSSTAPGVNIVTMHMNGHAGHSGYDRLTAYLDGKLLTGPERFSFFQKVIARVLKPLTKNSGLYWYHRSNLIAELDAARQWFWVRGEVFHFLYGENSFRYLGAMKRIKKGNAIVGTFHTPPEKFSRVVDDESHLLLLDAVIVMSTMQISFFQNIVGEDKVFFIPHGVDVDYFFPIEKKNSGENVHQCLFVGSHLRDFETLAVAVEFVRRKNSSIEFVVVTPERNHSYFSEKKNVRLFARVPDDMLLKMYQSSDLFVLPLQECTANNVLLEAMACGLPIVATDLQGVRDYASSECAVMVPGKDADALANAIIGLCADKKKQDAMRLASRKRALEFRWETIAVQLYKVYKSLVT